MLLLDISGFTNLATRLDVDALQKHINQYFTALLDITTAHGGDALRFMGDALLVTWALPLERELEPHELDPAHGELEPHEPSARRAILEGARSADDARAMGAVALERCSLPRSRPRAAARLRSTPSADTTSSRRAASTRCSPCTRGSASAGSRHSESARRAHSEFLVTGDVIRQQVATALTAHPRSASVC